MLKFKAIIAVFAYLLLFVSCAKTKAFDPEAQAAIDDKLIVEFLAKNNITAAKHSTGIYYQVITPGSGVAATSTSIVVVNYTGRLLNGTVFDQSPSGAPATFSLNAVIEGWKIGIPLVEKGGTIRLIIPSYYAYRNMSPGTGIPANAVLDFTIQVVNVQ